jgi:hypothetical protein
MAYADILEKYKACPVTDKQMNFIPRIVEVANPKDIEATHLRIQRDCPIL